MHEMDNTPRILTIIGLILEGLGAIGGFFGYWILTNFSKMPGVNATSMEMTQDDFNELLEIIAWLADFVLVIAVVMVVFFVISLVLFTKLMRGKFTEETAKKVYLYQAIWGGFNLLFNQITGILYLISGVGGYNGHREERDIREGI